MSNTSTIAPVSVDRRKSSRERRVAPRAPLVAAVLKWRGRKSQLAQTVNIGPRGMTLVRLADDDAYATGTALWLQFQLPGADDHVVELTGEVTFDAPAGPYRQTGVRFAEVAEADASLIAAFVATTVAAASPEEAGPRPLARISLLRAGARING